MKQIIEQCNSAQEAYRPAQKKEEQRSPQEWETIYAPERHNRADLLQYEPGEIIRP